MTLKEKIQEQEKKVENYESKIKEIDKLIEKCEKELKEHQSRQSLGVTQLLLDIVQPLATYNALDGTLQSISSTQDIAKLKSERNSLNTSLTLFKSSLAKMKQQEYEERKEAKLVSDENGIYIKGDETKTNVIEPLLKIIEEYTKQYNNLIESHEVKMYIKLSNELSEIVQQANFPEATPENMHQLEVMLRPHSSCPWFDIKKVENKIVVSNDFVTPFVTDLNERIKYHENIIEEAKQKFENFKPNLLGRVFKSVGEKQTQATSSKIEADIKRAEYRISQIKDEVLNIEKLKEKYITPSEEAIQKVAKLVELEKDVETRYYVNKYVKNGSTYEKNIKENTILKNSQTELFEIVMNEIKTVLDAQGVKLSQEKLFEEICKNKHLKNLSAEVVNALGYNPLSKQNQPE